MNTKVLYKPVSNVQIGHLYEHIVCTELTRVLVARGIFEYVDYWLDAKTFHEGYIRLEVTSYTSKGSEVTQNLTSLALDFNNESVDSALIQILAEKLADIRTFDDKVVAKRLIRLHERHWDDMDTYDGVLENDTLSTRYMNLTDRPARYFGKIEQSITIQKNLIEKKPDLLPLFSVVSKALRVNLQNEIASSSICYSYDDSFINNGTVADINLYRIDKRQARGLSDEAANASQLLKEMKDGGFVMRLADSLTGASSENKDSLPDDDEILRKTGKVVGPHYWKTVSTVENITELLSNAKITFTYGEDSSELLLSTHPISSAIQ